MFFRTRSTVSADGPGRPVRFAAHRQPLCWNFMYHSRIVLSVGASVRYMVRNPLALSQLTQFWQIPRHKTLYYSLSTQVLSRLSPNGETCKYATAPSTQTWRNSLPIYMLLSAVSVLVVAQPSSEFPEGLINCLVLVFRSVTTMLRYASRRGIEL
jgi:hypothetical protein